MTRGQGSDVRTTRAVTQMLAPDLESYATRPAGDVRNVVEVCAGILLACGLDAAALVGHDELKEGSRDPNKECPGRLLDVAALRDMVAATLALSPSVRSDLAW